MNKLKDIAPELSKLKKEKPFATPKGYFEDFPALLNAKIELEKQVEIKKKPGIIQFLKPLAGIAASFALIFMLVYVPFSIFMDKKTTELTEVAEHSNDIDFYFSDLLETLDENTLVSILNDETEQNTDLTGNDYSLFITENFSDYDIFKLTYNE